MAEKKTFTISYRSLLIDIAQNLEWPRPIFSQFDLSKVLAFVVVFTGHPPFTYTFIGSKRLTLMESEEEAAQKAVSYLVQARVIAIDDISLQKHALFKTCSAYFKSKRDQLKSLERVAHPIQRRKSKKSHAQSPRTILIDYWALLLQILSEFDIPFNGFISSAQPNGKRICSFVLSCYKETSRPEVFFGDASDSLDEARRSLAKKTIVYLQPLYGFVVKDVNYRKMNMAELRCKLERESYLCVKERVFGEETDVSQGPFLSDNECMTPLGPEHQIQVPSCLPPPPKKPKTTSVASASSSTARPIPLNTFLPIPDDVFEAFQAVVKK